MLYFYRKSFRSGVCVLKEPDGETVKSYQFKPGDNKQQFTFLDEAYMLAHYPGVIWSQLPVE